MKKLLAIILTILMIVTVIPFTPVAFAAEGDTRTIYVDWNFGWHTGSYMKMFFDSMGNELLYEFDFVEDNLDLYRIPVDAASYWFNFSYNGIHEGAIPEKVDYYEAATKTWYCSHNMNTSGKQTCKGFLCEICGEFYGEAAPDAHDWSKLDGICANGCGAVCDHAGQTGVCTICGKNNAVAMLTLEGAQPEYFSTFEEAIDEARRSENEGALVTVLQDINFGGYGADDFAYIQGGSFTIDLNGKKLNSPDQVFSLYKSEIDFIDSVGTAVVDGGEGYAIDVYNANANIYGGTYKGFCGIGAEAGTVIIDGANVKIENYNNWGYSGSAAIKATENGTITVKNSVISTAAEQTILCYDGSVINIEGGTISGSIYYVGGDVCLSGGTFLDGFAVDGRYINELSEFVKDGYAFYNSDGEVVSSSVKALSKACTVKEHTHSFTDSRCPCGYECCHENQTGSECEVCGKTLHTCDFSGEWKYDSEKHWKECTADSCDNTSGEASHEWSEDLVCSVCQAEAYFSVITGETTTYCVSFTDAYEKAEEGSTVKLLKKYDGPEPGVLDKAFIFDLAGNRWVYEGPSSRGNVEIRADVTFTDSVGGGYFDYGVLLQSEEGTFDGGSYWYIGLDGAEGVTLMDYLAPCRAYYNEAGEEKDLTNESWTGIKISVGPGNHDWSNKDGYCVNCGCECPHGDTYETITSYDHFATQNSDGTWTKAVISVVCHECDAIVEFKEADRADYTEFDKAMARIEELLETGNITEDEYNHYSRVVTNLKNNSSVMGSPFQETVDGSVETLNHMISEIEAGLADGTMKKPDWSYMTALFDEINALIDSNPGKLTPDAAGMYSGIYYGYYKSQMNNNNHSQADYDRVMSDNDYETKIEEILASIKDGTKLKADYTGIDEAIAEIEEKLADENVTDEAKAGLGEIKTELEEMKQNPLSSKADLAELEKALEDYETELDAGIADGSAVKADYTAIDEAIAEIEEKLADENVTDEAKAELEEIKSQLEEKKADGNTSAADLAELEKALEDYETELDAGIEDGSAVKVDGKEIFNEKIQEINDELIEKYGEEEFKKFSEALSDEVVAGIEKRTTAIYNEMSSLEGSVKDNEEKLAELKAELEAIFAELENCFIGTHNGLKFEVTEEAKCGKNAVESATCALCGETVTREVENTALTHSFTRYETVEEAKCGVAGKEVASCDNNCGATDTRETEALEHIFLNYIYNEDATCTADGTKTAICLNGCGETDTVTAEDTMLDHVDEDGDKHCDECENEIEETCPECGGAVHEGPYGQYICIIRMFIRLAVSLLRTLQQIYAKA